MTPAAFKKKWAKVSAKESATYQSHFDDLCRMLDHATPLEADPTGDEWFCFQKGVIKNLGKLDLAGEKKAKKGFADVWKKGCFGWEYKGQHKDLDEAYQQLQLYREALFNPPLLVVCDFLPRPPGETAPAPAPAPPPTTPRPRADVLARWDRRARRGRGVAAGGRRSSWRGGRMGVQPGEDEEEAEGGEEKEGGHGPGAGAMRVG